MNDNELKPGRELDALVAEKVMGQSRPRYVHDRRHLEPIVDGAWFCYPDYYHGDICEWEPLHFSTDIAAAWEVVEKMITQPGPDGDYWDIILDVTSIGVICVMGELADYRVDVRADTAPHAICLAALKAVTK